jgi:hypothetical protein
MALVLAGLICFWSGFALVSLCWPRGRWCAADILLRICLSAGYGIGIFSVVFYLSLVCFSLVSAFRNLLVVDAVVFAVLVVALRLQSRMGWAKSAAVSPRDEESWPAWFQRTLTAAFVIVLLVALYFAVMRTLAFPQGEGWDAFAIWNLHARFLFIGGDHWRDGFTSMVGGSHPDYPLLLPAAIAHFWACLGGDDPRVPAVIGMVFTWATVGALYAALSTLRSRVQAMMGAIALLSTPFFTEQGTAQYADVPLSFFFLSAVVLLCLFDVKPAATPALGRSGQLVLAGLAAGLAAWTKNEGLLFLVAIVAARLVILIRAARTARDATPGDTRQTKNALWAGLVPLLAALVPGLLLVAYYKHSIGIPGDLFSDPATALPKLLDPARYWAIIAGYGKGLFRFGRWLWVPGTLLMLGLSIASGRDARFTRQPGFRTSLLALALTLAGYFAVFLITPYDIHWHLRFSLVRLFLQLWPSAVFLVFLSLRGAPARLKPAI